MSQPYDILCPSDNREEWLSLRRTGIGASDAPGVLGLSPWASPLSIAADKLGVLPEQEETEPMRAGKKLERIIAEWAAEEIGADAEMFGFLLRSRDHPFMLATPDARVRELDGHAADGFVPLQVKNSARVADWTEGVPEAVDAQIQHELAVTGGPFGYAAVLLVGQRLRWAKVERNDKFIDEVLIPAERDLWEKIQSGARIPADASEATRKAIAALWPQDTGEEILLGADFLERDLEREQIKAEMAELQNRLDWIENAIRAEMRDASFGTLPNGVRYSLRTVNRKEYTVKAASYRMLRRAAAKEM